MKSVYIVEEFTDGKHESSQAFNDYGNALFEFYSALSGMIALLDSDFDGFDKKEPKDKFLITEEESCLNGVILKKISIMNKEEYLDEKINYKIYLKTLPVK